MRRILPIVAASLALSSSSNAIAQNETGPVQDQPVPAQNQTAAGQSDAAPAQNQPRPEDNQTGPPKTKMDIYGYAMTDTGYDFGRVDPLWFDVVRPTKLPASSYPDSIETGRSQAVRLATREELVTSSPSITHGGLSAGAYASADATYWVANQHPPTESTIRATTAKNRLCSSTHAAVLGCPDRSRPEPVTQVAAQPANRAGERICPRSRER
jgi:hypothetical protein